MQEVLKKKVKVLSVVICQWLAIGLLAQAKTPASGEGDPLDQYNVVWRTPSNDSSGSMPTGNGDIGLNVWVEEDGDLLFYISKTDAWSENVRLLKPGRVRVSLSPNPFLKGLPFRQTLKLRQGEIEILAGKKGSKIRIRIWVDAHHPVIRVEAHGEREFDIQVSLEVWRKEKRELQGKELFSAYGMNDGPHSVFVHPDTLLDEKSNRIVWFHRNEESVWPLTMKHQGLESLMPKLTDPIRNRAFGGAIEGVGLARENATTLKSAKAGRCHLVSVYVLTAQTATADEWVRQLDKVIAEVAAEDLEQTRRAHRKWWDEFWNRSWIRVSGATPAPKNTTRELPVRIGADSDGHNQFVGRISRARIFRRALNPKEIETLARGKEAGQSGNSDLVAHRTFKNPEGGAFSNAAGDYLTMRIVASKALTGSGFQISQGYALQRFINACGGRGAFPIKFNGSIFTVDAREPNENFDAEYGRLGRAVLVPEHPFGLLAHVGRGRLRPHATSVPHVPRGPAAL